MANLLDYLAWRGDLDFSQSPLNPVDYVILSQLAYLPFDGFVPTPEETGEATVHLALKQLLDKLQSEKYRPKTELSFKEDPEFIKALISSNRFRNCHLLGYVNKIDLEREFQFSALCVHNTTDGSCCMVFRGTDASFVGWKEDFNMAFREVIPSQLEAVKYIEKMAPMFIGNLRTGGHSKGGNLAIYAAAFCGKRIQDRITDIYANDAPGFYEKVVSSEGFAAIKDRIHSYVPQGSVVGMLLENGTGRTVIKSSEIGLMQHSLFSWEVAYNDMVHADQISQSSIFVDKTIRDWIASLDSQQRERFIEALYTILSTSEINTIHDMENSWLTSAGRIIKSLGNIDEPTRKMVSKTISELFRSAGRNINTLLKQNKDE